MKEKLSFSRKGRPQPSNITPEEFPRVWLKASTSQMEITMGVTDENATNTSTNYFPLLDPLGAQAASFPFKCPSYHFPHLNINPPHAEST